MTNEQSLESSGSQSDFPIEKLDPESDSGAVKEVNPRVKRELYRSATTIYQRLAAQGAFRARATDPYGPGSEIYLG